MTDDVLMSLQDGAVILGRREGGGGVQCSWGPDPGYCVETGWDLCTLWRRDGTDALCGDGMGLMHFVETGWD